MAFKDTQPQFAIIDLHLIETDPTHPRQKIDEASLKGLVNSIRKTGLIHPLVVQPANAAGRHTLIVGERRWRAAQLAGETSVPALIRPCEAAEALELRVFENLGLGVRSALEPREMANAIKSIAERFDTPDAAADHFGRSQTWLTQATAAANLSPKVSALLDSGKISSTSAAVQLEKLAQKNEAKADTLIDQIEQLPEGEKIAKKIVDEALSEEGGRRKKKDEIADEAAPATANEPAAAIADVPPWEELPDEPIVPARRRVTPGKVKRVADLLGLTSDDEDEILAHLIDQFLAAQDDTQA